MILMKKKIVEAALFMSSEPMPLDRLSRISGVHSLGHLKEIIEELQKDYSERGINIIKTSDGWMMNVKQDILPAVAHLTPYSDLAEGHKRTLALVAYKEPIKQADIIRIQGNKAYSYIKELSGKGLIKSEKVGHTKILSLTQEFERYFGEEKAKIRERLEEHSKQPEPQKEPAEEYQFTEEKAERKKKARVSVKREEKEAVEEEGKTEKEIRASHSHAFQEIE